ncbi:CreA protein [Aliiruegeria haliotis]|uniref:CreA protein n=1 Tax=Aliiruegeria haliotis TaxID=1280846 RepID=A0A2T0RLU0_9RHOB|nr:CreA family protein [Aliiruegeria haliotis]PRY22154.1 CreA protein [Aliiruegeria haliotis]
MTARKPRPTDLKAHRTSAVNRAGKWAKGASLLVALATPLSAHADVVAEVGVDWVGNDVIVEVVQDPDLPQVACYVSYFDRGMIDRLQKGNWFEDPSYSAIDCVATGPIASEDIANLPRKEKIFSERQSLILKSLKVTRIADPARNALVYLSHGAQVTDGSGKMALSAVVPLQSQ